MKCVYMYGQALKVKARIHNLVYSAGSRVQKAIIKLLAGERCNSFPKELFSRCNVINKQPCCAHKPWVSAQYYL